MWAIVTHATADDSIFAGVMAWVLVFVALALVVWALLIVLVELVRRVKESKDVTKRYAVADVADFLRQLAANVESGACVSFDVDWPGDEICNARVQCEKPAKFVGIEAAYKPEGAL